MFNHHHYVPMLKAKEGEFKALQETTDTTKDLMTPLFDIIGIPWDYEDGKEAKTIEEHLNKLPKKIVEAWGTSRRLFVDSYILDGDLKMSDGTTHYLEYLFNDFRAQSLHVVPVTGSGRHPEYKNSVLNVISKDQGGLCYRVESEDLGNPDFVTTIESELKYYNLNPAQVDLIIDLKNIDQTINVQLLSLTISTFITGVLPYLNDWRSLTVSSTSFPFDLREINANTIDKVDRKEWELHNLILSKVNRLPSFGDYSIANTEGLEMDPRFITVSASIRYTHDDYWLIVRGASTKKHGWNQYHNLCQNLVPRQEYSGNTYSWGDKYIDDCANQAVGCGNATTWRKVGNNHHFQKVVDQIASLP